MVKPQAANTPQDTYPSAPTENSKSIHSDLTDQPGLSNGKAQDIETAIAKEELDEALQELDQRWILNLSMHFRDKSACEKFFVTYIEAPTLWRRVTISIDFRSSPPDSFERDLESLQSQRDKSWKIYEALNESLPDIQFYDSVTNLRLETAPDGRLHVHVTEDVNEAIPFPPASAVNHPWSDQAHRVPEKDIIFDSHISGFVYKVHTRGLGACVMKQVPSPDSIEEFLYEIKALDALQHVPHTIQYHGLVTNDAGDRIKGALIRYTDHDPLIDKEYDSRDDLEALSSGVYGGKSVLQDAIRSSLILDDIHDVQFFGVDRDGKDPRHAGEGYAKDCLRSPLILSPGPWNAQWTSREPLHHSDLYQTTIPEVCDAYLQQLKQSISSANPGRPTRGSYGDYQGRNTSRCRPRNRKKSAMLTAMMLSPTMVAALPAKAVVNWTQSLSGGIGAVFGGVNVYLQQDREASLGSKIT